MNHEQSSYRAIDQTKVAIDVAVLKEQMTTVTTNLADMKVVNKSQSDKLDRVLDQLARADGGWKAVMWLGGAFGAISAIAVGWVNYFFGKHP